MGTIMDDDYEKFYEYLGICEGCGHVFSADEVKEWKTEKDGYARPMCPWCGAGPCIPIGRQKLCR